MRTSLAIWVLGVLALLGAGCAGAAPTATPAATSSPLPGPIATPVAPAPTPPPAPTPASAREWDLEETRVDGSTVTVVLRVYAGIDVGVTLDGRDPDRVAPPSPFLEFVFDDVEPGSHTVEVGDVVGHVETVAVVVATPSAVDGGRPSWLGELVRRLGTEPVTNPPASVLQYEYQGRTVYFVPPRCCDIFADLYDADGEIIAHPEGGITGQGDGRAPDFLAERRDERLVWRDGRAHDPGLVQVMAPIESAEVLILESFPPQYNVVVVSGLPNACVTLAGYRVDRDDATIRLEVLNWKPADQSVACAEVYGTAQTTIPLGSDFESGRTYTLVVNGLAQQFDAQ